MTLLWQFLLHNLLPSLVAGLLAWLLIYGAITLLHVQHGRLRLPLLYMPLVKSTLVLLGVGLVLPWPRDVFATWRAQALPWQTVLPLLVIWGGGALLARDYFVRRARQQALQAALPADEAAPRLSRALERVLRAYQTTQCSIVGKGPIRCCVDLNRRPSRPQLLVSRRHLASPLVVTAGGEPTIVFPVGLVSRLNDDELLGALAHEMAHLMIRRPHWCSDLLLRHLTPLSPVAGLIAAHLSREEEQACDDTAVAVLQQPAVYAAMLLKSYRFARERGGVLARLSAAPQLLGLKPAISDRIERLVQRQAPSERLLQQLGAACAVWIGLGLLFFS